MLNTILKFSDRQREVRGGREWVLNPDHPAGYSIASWGEISRGGGLLIGFSCSRFGIQKSCLLPAAGTYSEGTEGKYVDVLSSTV